MEIFYKYHKLISSRHTTFSINISSLFKVLKLLVCFRGLVSSCQYLVNAVNQACLSQVSSIKQWGIVIHPW